MKYCVVILAIFGFTGCAGSTTSMPKAAAETEEEAQADQQLMAKRAEAGYRCQYVHITGSRIKQRICSTAATREYNRTRAKEFMTGFGPGNGTPQVQLNQARRRQGLPAVGPQ